MKQACRFLADAGWLSQDDTPTGGRRRGDWTVNPLLWAAIDNALQPNAGPEKAEKGEKPPGLGRATPFSAFSAFSDGLVGQNTSRPADQSPADEGGFI